MKYLIILAAFLVSSTAKAQEISEAEYNNLVKEINSPETEQKVKNFLANLKNFKVSGGGDLDLMWRYYHMSGSKKIIEKIIQLLDSDSFSTGNAAIDKIVRDAAQMSLAANAGKYGEVKRIIIEQANSLPNGELKTKLIKIINEISK